MSVVLKKQDVHHGPAELSPEDFAYLNRSNHARDITKRFVLYVGFKCNLRCQFCYYLKSIEDGTAKNDTYEDLSKKIIQARKLGKTEIDFTGGEATIHPDFTKLVTLCKELGFETINVISNGWKLASTESFQKYAAAGLNEVLFSLHSYDEKVHDQLTQIPKSQSKILTAINNAHLLGIRVRINSVVNKINYSDLDNHLEFIKKLRPHSMNLIVFNPTEETPGYKGHDNVRFGSYEEIGGAVGRALSRHANDFNVINVRFLPFCFAKGHEAHIRTYWQEIYEKQEWDPMLHWAFRKNWFFVAGAVAAGFLISLFQPGPTNKGRKNLYTRFSEYFQLMRTRYLFTHTKACGGCSMKRICPGIQRDFAKQHPDLKVEPYTKAEWPEIVNPVLFGARYPEKFPALAEDLERRRSSQA